MVCFFFFKQKTAYEIYQCDWSSDVCSSDLTGETNSKYRIIYRVDMENTLTGEIEQGFYGVDTDTVKSIQEMESDAQDMFSERYPEAGQRVVGARVIKGFINPNFV